MSIQSNVPVQPSGVQCADTKAENKEKRQLANPMPEVKERQIRGIPWLAICFALSFSCILYGLDTTIVADVQGSSYEVKECQCGP